MILTRVISPTHVPNDSFEILVTFSYTRNFEILADCTLRTVNFCVIKGKFKWELQRKLINFLVVMKKSIDSYYTYPLFCILVLGVH